MIYYFEGYTQEEKEQIKNNILEEIKKMNEEVSDLFDKYEEKMKKYDKEYNYYAKKSEEDGYDTVGKEWTELMKIKEKAYEEYIVIYNYYYDNF